MDYIDKLDLQSEEIKEVENLEKHTINEPLSVNAYIGHDRDFLAIDGEYNDGFNQLNETNSIGISCNVSKKVNNIKNKIDNEMNRKGRLTQINLIDGMPNIYKYTTDDYYPMWEELLNDPRVTREILGKDQSDTYDIYLYKYEPTEYNSTLFVTCAIHGWEHFSSYCMLQVFKILLNDKDLPLQFLELSKTRILCIPIANPWGTNNNPSLGFVSARRGNVNGVDINRNFGYRWEYSSVNNTFGLSKGTSAFSEKETQYIRDVFNRYSINHFTDLHSFEKTSSEPHDIVIYGNEKARANTEQYMNWYKSVYNGIKIGHTTTENDSTANNYVNQVLGIPSINLELQRKRFAKDDSEIDIDCTRWTEHVINYLNFQAQSHFNKVAPDKNGVMIQSDRVVRETLWSIPTTWTPVPEMTKEIEIKEDGILIVTGWLTVKGQTTSESTLTYDPVINQKYKAKGVSLRNRAYVSVNSTSPMVINFSVMTYCEKGHGNAKFDLNIIKEGSGTALLDRQDSFYAFIPCKVGTVILPQHKI